MSNSQTRAKLRFWRLVALTLMAIIAEVVVFFGLIRLVAPGVPLIVGLVVILLTIVVAFFIGRILRRWEAMRQERRSEPPPKYPPRYTPSISVITVLFAAVLGFGLKNLLDTPVNDKKPEQTYTFQWLTVEPGQSLTVELYTYKWLFFLVATFIFLRFLTASANLLWLEYQKYERDYRRLDDIFVSVGFFWLTVFGIFGAYLCYAGKPSEFFWRAGLLLSATLVGSLTQWLGFVFRLTSPRGRWGDWWSLINGSQLAAVVVLGTGWLGTGTWTWGTRLLVLAVASALILGVDFVYWQLKQIAK